MRVKSSLAVKLFVAVFSLIGILLNFISANEDGYSHWSKRLLYFTAQSNVWIALILLLIVFAGLNKSNDGTRVKDILYVLRFVFVVSITLTGFIFCFVLAPGAENDNYNAWTLGSIFVHVTVPILSVIDFFLDPVRVRISKLHVVFSLVPPLLYLVFASILGGLGVDFGRGDNFPYFFMNYSSPAGIFGTSDVMPYKIGSFYWIVFMLLIILLVGFSLRALYNLKRKGTGKETLTEK